MLGLIATAAHVSRDRTHLHALIELMPLALVFSYSQVQTTCSAAQSSAICDWRETINFVIRLNWQERT